MDAEFLQEIRRELDKLQERVSEQRNQGADRNQVEQTVNVFETAWLERFVNEERAEARGVRTGIETTFDRQAEEQRLQASQRDNARMPNLNPYDQVAYTDGSRHGIVPSLMEERNRATQIQADTDQAKSVIRDQYANLRQDFVKALQGIESGQSHNFSLTPVRQVTEQSQRENTDRQRADVDSPKTWEERMAQRIQENGRQEAQRQQQEQEQGQQRGIER